MAKVISKALAALHRVQDNLAILTTRVETFNRIDAIRARLRACEGEGAVLAPQTTAPAYWQRPAEYRIPSYGQGRRWLASRMGLLPVERDTDGARILCLACGIPIAVSTGDKTLRGTRGAKVLERGTLTQVTVGAVVKIRDTENASQDWTTGSHGYMETSREDAGDEDEDQSKVIVVMQRGLGCLHCQRQYARVSADVKRENATKHAAYHALRNEYLAKVRLFIANNPEIPDAEQRALLTYTGTPPTDRAPYIAVDVKVIAPEQTVAYWHGQTFKDGPKPFVPKALPATYTPVTAPMIHYRDFAISLLIGGPTLRHTWDSEGTEITPDSQTQARDYWKGQQA